MAQGSRWVYFDRVLSLYKDSSEAEAIHRGFRHPLHAQAFRSLAYSVANVSTSNEVVCTLGDGGSRENERLFFLFSQNKLGALAMESTLQIQRSITILNQGSGRIANIEEIRRALGNRGWEVEQLEIRPQDSFVGIVRDLARSRIIISRHDGALANSVFLPPNSAIFEILPYNFE